MAEIKRSASGSRIPGHHARQPESAINVAHASAASSLEPDARPPRTCVILGACVVSVTLNFFTGFICFCHHASSNSSCISLM